MSAHLRASSLPLNNSSVFLKQCYCGKNHSVIAVI